MNYQLLHSLQKQKHNKIDSRHNFSSLSRYIQPRAQQIEQQFSFQSPMPIKLVHYKSQSRTMPDQSESEMKRHKICYKIKHKKVHLPSIDKKYQKIQTIGRLYQPSTHKILKKRVKTETTHPNDSEQTMLKISQVNYRINKRRQSKTEKECYRPQQRNSREKDWTNDWMKNSSKQKEYEQYVHQLQNKYRYRQSQININLQQQAQIQQKLRNRVETKKYVYGKPNISEFKQNQKEIQNTSLSHSKLTKNTIKQQIQHPQVNLETTQDQEEANRYSKRSAINDDFIKILRMAKNRGASLLIKLKKYPSKKLIAA